MAKIKLVEKILVQVAKENMEIFKNPVLFESEGKTYSKKGILRGVPITRFTENLNGRVYSKALWEMVENKGTFNGSSCMADHPEDDGSVKDISGIWSNFRVEEDVAVADLTVVGAYGKNMLEIVEAEGKLGFSTVGMGELSEDNKTVDPNSYEYERTDWVTVPSQQVYATKENLGESIKDINTHIIKEVTNNSNDNVIINKEIKEELEVNNMVDKIQEIAFKNQVNRTIKESKKKENILEAIEDLSMLVIPEVMVEESNAVKQAINVLQEKLETSNKQLEEKVAKSEESFTDIKTKYEVQSKMLESMKAKFQKIDTVLKEHGLESIKDIETLKESVTDAVHDIGILSEEKSNLLSDLKQVMSERVDMLKDIKVFMKKQKMSEADRKKVMRLIDKLKEELSKEKKYSGHLESLLKKEGYKIVEEDEDDDEKEDKKADEKEDKKKESKKSSDEVSSMFTEEDDEDEDEEFEEAEDKDDDEDEKSDDDKMAAVRAAKKESKFRKNFIKEEDEDDEDEDEDDDKKKESYIRKTVKKELTEFYNEQVKTFPGLKDFKESIINSNSFMDATKRIEKIKSKKQDQVKFSEIKLDTTWIPQGRM